MGALGVARRGAGIYDDKAGLSERLKNRLQRRRGGMRYGKKCPTSRVKGGGEDIVVRERVVRFRKEAEGKQLEVKSNDDAELVDALWVASARGGGGDDGDGWRDSGS